MKNLSKLVELVPKIRTKLQLSAFIVVCVLIFLLYFRSAQFLPFVVVCASGLMFVISLYIPDYLKSTPNIAMMAISLVFLFCISLLVFAIVSSRPSGAVRWGNAATRPLSELIDDVENHTSLEIRYQPSTQETKEAIRNLVVCTDHVLREPDWPTLFRVALRPLRPCVEVESIVGSTVIVLKLNGSRIPTLSGSCHICNG